METLHLSKAINFKVSFNWIVYLSWNQWWTVYPFLAMNYSLELLQKWYLIQATCMDT